MERLLANRSVRRGSWRSVTKNCSLWRCIIVQRFETCWNILWYFMKPRENLGVPLAEYPINMVVGIDGPFCKLEWLSPECSVQVHSAATSKHWNSGHGHSQILKPSLWGRVTTWWPPRQQQQIMSKQEQDGYGRFTFLFFFCAAYYLRDFQAAEVMESMIYADNRSRRSAGVSHHLRIMEPHYALGIFRILFWKVEQQWFFLPTV